MLDDIMEQQWACLSCNKTFPFGRLRMKGRRVMQTGVYLYCPECASNDVYPADKTVHVLPEYQGDIPAVKH